MPTFCESTTYRTESCCNCGIQFAFTEGFYQNAQRTGGTFYCPNGHPQHYTKTREQRLQEALDFEKKKLQWKDEELNGLRGELRSQKFKTMAERSAKARLKKRIAHGVCPCCHRTFRQLSAHIASKHPDFIQP